MIKSGYNDPSKYKCWKLYWATLIDNTAAAIVQWLASCVVAAETQVQVLDTALIFFYFLRIRLLPVICLDIIQFIRRQPRSGGQDLQKPRLESWSRHLFSFIFFESDFFLNILMWLNLVVAAESQVWVLVTANCLLLFHRIRLPRVIYIFYLISKWDLLV